MIESRTTVHTLGSDSGTAPKKSALLLVGLMVLLPWSTFGDYELVDTEESSYTVQRAWGSSGYNDTGWVDLVASGADPTNQTFAYGDMFLDFAPGAEISNLCLLYTSDAADE